MTTRWNPFAANRHLTARVPIVGIEKVMRVQAAFAPMFAKSRLVRYGFLNGLPGFVTIEVGNSVKTTPGGGRWAGYGCLCRAQPGEAAAPRPRAREVARARCEPSPRRHLPCDRRMQRRRRRPARRQGGRHEFANW